MPTLKPCCGQQPTQTDSFWARKGKKVARVSLECETCGWEVSAKNEWRAGEKWNKRLETYSACQSCDRYTRADIQKLVDACFSMVFTSFDVAGLTKMKREEKAAWVRHELSRAGFKTIPMGASWGVLTDHPQWEAAQDPRMRPECDDETVDAGLFVITPRRVE